PCLTCCRSWRASHCAENSTVRSRTFPAPETRADRSQASIGNGESPRVAQRDVHRQQKWLGNVLCCIQSMCREAELLSHGKPRKQGEQDGSSSRFVLDRLLALISLRNPWELPHFW